MSIMSAVPNLVYVLDKAEIINLAQRKNSTEKTENEDKPLIGLVEAQTESLLQQFLKEHRAAIKRGTALLLHLLVLGYLAYASYYFYTQESKNDFNIGPDGRCHGHCNFQWCNGYGMLLILIILVYIGMFYYLLLKPLYGKQINNTTLKPIKKFYKTSQCQKITFPLLRIIILVALAIFLYFGVRDDVARLMSLIGPAVFLLIGFTFSTKRRAIPWDTVLIGISLQFLLGFCSIRWEVGRKIFECLGNKIETFMKYVDLGSRFIFGDVIIIEDKVLAFAVLPVIFFFSFFISILYYYGAMQWIIMKMGWILQIVLGTTVCESVNAVANIFLGMTDAPLLIRPYIKILTHSEIHSIMVSGFATVSGTILAAYISFGAKPQHLITSTIMATPATMAWSKLFYPEDEQSQSKSENIKMEKSEDSSVLDAASNGANIAIGVILSIIANLVAFVSFVTFVNGIVDWLGYLVGLDGLSLELVFSKIFIPLSWIIGVPWEECEAVAQVIATKTVINELVAYEKLEKFKDAALITGKSAVIATFAICGFANPSSFGICIGTLGAMAPERRAKIAKVALRSFVVGCIVCFCSASFAGLLMPPERYYHNNANTTTTSTTATIAVEATKTMPTTMTTTIPTTAIITTIQTPPTPAIPIPTPSATPTPSPTIITPQTPKPTIRTPIPTPPIPSPTPQIPPTPSPTPRPTPTPSKTPRPTPIPTYSTEGNFTYIRTT